MLSHSSVFCDDQAAIENQQLSKATGLSDRRTPVCVEVTPLAVNKPSSVGVRNGRAHGIMGSNRNDSRPDPVCTVVVPPNTAGGRSSTLV